MMRGLIHRSVRRAGRAVPLVAALLLAAPRAAAQTSREDPSDVQAWYGAGVRLDLPRRWEADLRYRLRTDHDATTYAGSYLTAELGRAVHRRLSLEGGYRLALADGASHRWSVAAKLSADAGPLRLSLRPMLQYRMREDPDEEGLERTVLRTRLRAERDLTPRLELYASAEPYFRFDGQARLRGWRNTLGARLEYAPDRGIDVFYAYRPDYAKAYNRAFHVVGVDLEFDAKLGRSRAR